jgi:hypothetical protein
MAASKTMLTGGAFQDGEGNPLSLGYLKMKLSQDASVSGVGNICSGIELTIQLDVNGNVVTSPAQSVWANTGGVLAPINTYYKVTGYTAAGQRAWGTNNQQVAAGSTFNLGSWVPNSVISWFPNPQSLALEINGSPASSQTVQNLEAGANITITDEGSGNIEIAAASGGASFNGNGAYFFGPGIVDPALISGINLLGVGTNNLNGSNNAVQVYLFELLAEFTISKCSQICLSNDAGNFGYFGIYSFSGNLLVNGGSFVQLSGSGVQTNSFTPVTLPPGTYWHAQATSASGHGQWIGFQFTSNAQIQSLLTANTTRAAVAANPVVTGLPATLGTLTPNVPTSGDSVACPLYE